MKIKFKVINIKRNLFSIILCVFTLCIAIFCSQNLSATKKALSLWATTVVPSLLPFFMATELLKHTNVFSVLGKVLDKFMKPLFNVPGIGAGALVLGIISGYPIGGKVVSDLRQKKQITKIEAERLIAFTNNSGPLFILSAVGISMFSDKRIGILLLIIHILSCLTVGFIFRFYKINDKEVLKEENYILKNSSNSNISFRNLGTILRESINNSIINVLIIGGFITLSSVLLSILESLNLLDVFDLLLKKFLTVLNIPHELSNGTLYGIIEVTNGLNVLTNVIIKDYTFKIVLCSFLLGFGGFTVLLQVLGFTSTTDISIKPYFFGKLLQGFIASIYTYIVLKATNLFNLTIPVFSNNSFALNNKQLHLSQTLNTAWLIYPFVFLFIVFIILCFISLGKGNGNCGIRTNSYRNNHSSGNVKIRIK